jgi:hypothetical protein
VIQLPAGTKIWIAAGVTDLRRGFDGLSAQVQTALQQQPFSGHVFVFRGRRGDIVKLLWWDGDGLCLFAKRLERGRLCRAQHNRPWTKPLRGIRVTPASPLLNFRPVESVKIFRRVSLCERLAKA